MRFKHIVLAGTCLATMTAFALFAQNAMAQKSFEFTAATLTYTQDFDGLGTASIKPWWNADRATATFPHWYAQVENAATPGSFDLVANAGSPGIGAFYNYGDKSGAVTYDRALGSLGSGGTETQAYGIRFKNNTGSAIGSFQVSYTGEQWRETRSAQNTLEFFYRVRGSWFDLQSNKTAWDPVTTGNFQALHFNKTADAPLPGNARSNRAAIDTGAIAVTVQHDEEFWIGWRDIDDAGYDQGLAVDDLKVTVTLAAATATLSFQHKDTPWLQALPKGTNDNVVATFQATAIGADLDFSTVEIGHAGSGVAANVSVIGIWLDGNGDGQLNAGGRHDDLLQTEVFGAGATVSLTLDKGNTYPVTITDGTTKTFFVAYDFKDAGSGTYRKNDTYRAIVRGATATPTTAMITGLPIAGPEHGPKGIRFKDDFESYAPGSVLFKNAPWFKIDPQDPDDLYVGAAGTNQEALVALNGRADAAAPLSGAPFTHENKEILYVRADVTCPGPVYNGDYFLHFLDKGLQRQNFRGHVLADDGGTRATEFGITVLNSTGSSKLLRDDLPLNQPQRVVLEYDLGTGASRLWHAPASVNDTAAAVADNADPDVDLVSIRQGGSRSSPALRVDNLVVSTDPEDVFIMVSFGSQSVSDTTATPGVATSGVVVAAIDATLTGDEQSVRLKDVTLSASGLGDDRIVTVTLYVDNAPYGKLDGGDKPLGAKSYAADNGTIQYAINEALTQNTKVRYLVVYDLPATSVAGDVFTVKVESATVTGAPHMGTPISGADIVVGARLPSMDFASNNPTSRQVRKNDTDVVIADINVSVSTGTATLTQLRITDSGTGDAQTEVLTAALGLDVDASGTVSAPDITLDSKTFPSPDGSVTFTIPAAHQQIGTSTLRLFVVYAFGQTLTDGHVFEVTVDIPQGAVTGAKAMGLPLTKAQNATLSVSLLPKLVFASFTPASASWPAGRTDREIAVFDLSAVDGQVLLTDLTLDAVGTGNDATEITKVRLFKEANGNNVLDVHADLLMDEGSYATDDGTLTFDFGGTAPQLQNGQTMRLFLAYSFAHNAAPGGNFQLSVAAVTTSATIVTGLPIPSAVLTISTPLVRSSTGGGGCAVSPTSRSAPFALAPLMLLAAGLVLARRRRF
ncbi:MYXO-CTERM sorting domain-containing protein [Planctomycetota bacterium]